MSSKTPPATGSGRAASLGATALLAFALVGCATAAATPLGTTGDDEPTRLRAVGAELIQQARETADLALLDRAERAFGAVLDTEPDDVESIIGLGSIALSRHQFEPALELGRRAEAAAPGDARAIGIQVDALVELGRYEAAEETVERMVRTRPDLSSYARLSYVHELHGRLEPAIDAMEQAVVAGGPATENTEFARVALGDLWLLDGDLERATSLYRTALDHLPGSVPAMRGLARVAIANGDLPGAIALLEEAVARTPLPDLLVLLGETQEAAGRLDDADGTYQLVADIAHLARPADAAVEPGLAVFLADHGDPAEAVAMARASYDEAPSIRAADALAWALHRAGRSNEAVASIAEALGTGSIDPSSHFHAGVIHAALGQREEAIAELSRPGVVDGAWSALHQRAAADLLEELT
jgi:tetratricopeptide (TPR) repeat protein